MPGVSYVDEGARPCRKAEDKPTGFESCRQGRQSLLRTSYWCSYSIECPNEPMAPPFLPAKCTFAPGWTPRASLIAFKSYLVGTLGQPVYSVFPLAENVLSLNQQSRRKELLPIQA
jgi:hypothetical protein